MTEYIFTKNITDLSIQQIEKKAPCKRELYYFTYMASWRGYTVKDPIPLDAIIEMAESLEEGIQWLEEHNFIKRKHTYSIGNKFYREDEDRYFILAAVGGSKVALIDLITGARIEIVEAAFQDGQFKYYELIPEHKFWKEIVK